MCRSLLRKMIRLSFLSFTYWVFLTLTFFLFFWHAMTIALPPPPPLFLPPSFPSLLSLPPSFFLPSLHLFFLLSPLLSFSDKVIVCCVPNIEVRYFLKIKFWRYMYWYWTVLPINKLIYQKCFTLFSSINLLVTLQTVLCIDTHHWQWISVFKISHYKWKFNTKVCLPVCLVFSLFFFSKLLYPFLSLHLFLLTICFCCLYI